jgi:hypothetical protein
LPWKKGSRAVPVIMPGTPDRIGPKSRTATILAPTGNDNWSLDEGWRLPVMSDPKSRVCCSNGYVQAARARRPSSDTDHRLARIGLSNIKNGALDRNLVLLAWGARS